MTGRGAAAARPGPGLLVTEGGHRDGHRDSHGHGRAVIIAESDGVFTGPSDWHGPPGWRTVTVHGHTRPVTVERRARATAESGQRDGVRPSACQAAAAAGRGGDCQ